LANLLPLILSSFRIFVWRILGSIIFVRRFTRLIKLIFNINSWMIKLFIYLWRILGLSTVIISGLDNFYLVLILFTLFTLLTFESYLLIISLLFWLTLFNQFNHIHILFSLFLIPFIYSYIIWFPYITIFLLRYIWICY